jgi:hypothetical protein
LNELPVKGAAKKYSIHTVYTGECFCLKGILLDRNHINVGKELSQGTFYPSMNCGGLQRAIPACTAQAHFNSLPII